MATATKVDQVAHPSPGPGFSRPAALAIFLTRLLLLTHAEGQEVRDKLDEELEVCRIED